MSKTENENNEISFSADTVQDTTAIQPAAPSALQAAANASGILGEIDETDIKMPYLSIMQKMSEGDHPKGSLIFNKEIVVGDGNTPMNITVLTALPEYQEVIPYGESDVLPRRFPTKQAALDAGFSLDYEAEKRAERILTVMALIPVPFEYAEFVGDSKGEAVLKTLSKLETGEDVGFARAMWILRGSAFKSAGKKILSAGTIGHLKDGLFRGGWVLTTEEASFGKNKYFKPVIQSTGHHQPEIIEWLEKEVMA